MQRKESEMREEEKERVEKSSGEVGFLRLI